MERPYCGLPCRKTAVKSLDYLFQENVDAIAGYITDGRW